MIPPGQQPAGVVAEIHLMLTRRQRNALKRFVAALDGCFLPIDRGGPTGEILLGETEASSAGGADKE